MIVVTGSAGFIGSHLARTLRDSCGDIICCDPANKKLIQPTGLLEALIQKPEAIFHLGAISSTTEENTVSMTANNILFSCKLLEYSIKNQVPFIYASSASVYGLGENGFNEKAVLTPLNYYAISKVSFDMYVLQKIKDNPSAKIFGLRYFNVYGNNEDHKKDMASPVHKFLKQAEETSKIKVFKGSENFLRDFIHVEDAVSITVAAKKFDRSGIYNVGTGTARSFMDVANTISTIKGADVIEIPFPQHLVGKYQEFTCSDNAKIISAGYDKKRISLEDGIKRVLNV